MTTQQYDLIPGIDPSGLSAITQAQLLAFGAQAAPFDNIGFIIVGSGASSAHPNVTANPRFVRYIWLDTQTPGSVLIKVYQGTYPSDTYADWLTIQIADDSITAAKIADYAVSLLNGAGASKIAYKEDATADATKSNYMVRLDAAGQFLEVAPLSTMVAALTVNPAKIDISSATNGYVLTYDSSLGYAVWKALTISGLIAANSLSYDRLLNGTPGYLLRAAAGTGIWEQVINDDEAAAGGLLALRSLRLSVLSDTGCTAGDTLRFDGTNWAKTTPFYSTAGAALSAALTGNVAHGLGAVPRLFQAYIKYNGAGSAGYVAGDIVDINAILNAAGNCAIGITADATNLTYTQFSITALEVRHKTTGLSTAITEADWNWVYYASL